MAYQLPMNLAFWGGVRRRGRGNGRPNPGHLHEEAPVAQEKGEGASA